MQEMQVRPLGQEDPLEEEMATHSSILAWQIPWTEEPGGLRLHNLATKSPPISTVYYAGQDYPCGPVVKNAPTNTGDTGSIPGLGRSHMLWVN